MSDMRKETAPNCSRRSANLAWKELFPRNSTRLFDQEDRRPGSKSRIQTHRQLPARHVRLRRGGHPLEHPGDRLCVHPRHRPVPAVPAGTLSQPRRGVSRRAAIARLASLARTPWRAHDRERPSQPKRHQPYGTGSIFQGAMRAQDFPVRLAPAVVGCRLAKSGAAGAGKVCGR